MELYMPVRIFNEKNCVRNHSRALAELGSRALVVTGKRSSRMNGALEDVTEALEREGIGWVLYDRTEENPSVRTVMEARNLGLSEKTDFVIGVGGGSPMDAAKAIALMIGNPARGEELLYRKAAGNRVNPAIPVACVPTTAGTGSEVTPYAILTREVLPDIVLRTLPETESSAGSIPGLSHLNQKIKQSISHRIFPSLALVDCSYLQTASRRGCVNTAVDTLAHLIESHLNANATSYSRFYSETGLRIWARGKDRLLRYEIGEEERNLLMNACTLGGMAITHTGTCLPHALSYPVTCEMEIPHGQAVGIFLPGFLQIYTDQEAVTRTLSLLDFGSSQTFGEYIRKLLGEVKIPDELWERDMDNLLANPAKLKNYPFQLDREKLNRVRPVW